MLKILVLALWLPSAAQSTSGQHVRSSEPRIQALIKTGQARSVTFRGLLDALDASDVIVYIESHVARESRQTVRQNLDAYLLHQVASQGGYRYLRIAVGARGSERRLIAILAHELQHAIEVAQAPAVRDSDDIERMFSALALTFGCGGTTCYETQAAKDVERIVSQELTTEPNGRRTKDDP